MKKLLIMMLMAILTVSSFAFEGFSKESSTEDGYPIKLYQIDKSEHPDSYEFYVRLFSHDSEEVFTWCFNKIADTMEHFKWLETIEVVSSYDKRESWRTYTFDSEIMSSGAISYWISKKWEWWASWR